MPVRSYDLPTENIEGFTDFNIKSDWYKNRKPGLSAVIRCCGEEQWIGVCIESILPFFDEIIVTLTDCEQDHSEDIIKSFKSKKIKIFKYPFKIYNTNKLNHKRPKNIPGFFATPSVHNFCYYTNWGMSKTSYSHVSPKWDPDMIMRPEFCNNKFKHLIQLKNTVIVTGYNITDPDFKHISKTWPYQGPEPRFYKVNKYRFFYRETDEPAYRGLPQLFYFNRWTQFPVQQAQCLFNNMIHQDIHVWTPIFLHTKLIKNYKYYAANNRFLNSRNSGLNKTKIANYKKISKEIHINVPSFVFKKPNDYLNA